MVTSPGSNSMGESRSLAGVQDNLPVTGGEPLDGGLPVGDARHHHVALVGRGLLAHDDEVTVHDPGVDHRVPPHRHHEQCPRAGEVLGQGVELLHVLLGQDARTGGHVADQGDVADRPGVHDHLRGGVVADLDGAGLGRVPPQVPLALEHGQVGVDGGGGGETDRLADLADGRGVAPLPDRLRDAVQNLLALGAEYLGHGSPWSSRASPPGSPDIRPDGERLFAEASPERPEANTRSKNRLTTNRRSW